MLVEAFTKDVKGHLVPVWAHHKWYLCANQVYKTSHRIIRSKRNALIFKLIPLSTALSYWTCLNIVGSFGLFEVCKVCGRVLRAGGFQIQFGTKRIYGNFAGKPSWLRNTIIIKIKARPDRKLHYHQNYSDSHVA